MFARWNRMAKQFARVAKDIALAVKSGGADPQSNPTLRRVMQNARAINMPKDKVEAAIKRASGRDAASYHEVLYEGYAPHGVALLVETATDNRRAQRRGRNIITKNGATSAPLQPPSSSGRWACSGWTRRASTRTTSSST
jgi:transcriptional/translational regulatory protein YebC/TACO1